MSSAKSGIEIQQQKRSNAISSAAHSGQTDSERTLRIVARSHAGRVRPNNEDSIGFTADEGIAVLADGMGGLNAGEVASRHAVDLVLQGLTAGLPIGQVVEDANSTIYQLSQANAELNNMGTTLVALRAVGEQLWLANVGDSRIYRFRNQQLEQLTTDHSVVQQFVDSGLMTPDEARVAPNRNIITRALGIESEVEVDVSQTGALERDLYMLCSDGVSDMLAPDVLQQLFCEFTPGSASGSDSSSGVDSSSGADSLSGAAAPPVGPDLPGLVDAIVDAANAAGGLDNISAVLVHVAPSGSNAPGESGEGGI